MPVVTITFTGEAPDLALVSAALDAVTGGGVWVYWLRAEEATHACPVVVVRALPRPGEVVREGLAVVARAVAEACGVPLDDVWVQWVEVARDRVFAGGSVLDERG
jgi:phenylpyruvate tautomerase PptA (4-oxalocrotonate tautomerase family)